MPPSSCPHPTPSSSTAFDGWYGEGQGGRRPRRATGPAHRPMQGSADPNRGERALRLAAGPRERAGSSPAAGTLPFHLPAEMCSAHRSADTQQRVRKTQSLGRSELQMNPCPLPFSGASSTIRLFPGDGTSARGAREVAAGLGAALAGWPEDNSGGIGHAHPSRAP